MKVRRTKKYIPGFLGVNGVNPPAGFEWEVADSIAEQLIRWGWVEAARSPGGHLEIEPEASAEQAEDEAEE